MLGASEPAVALHRDVVQLNERWPQAAVSASRSKLPNDDTQ